MAELSSLAKSRVETIHPSSITARGDANRGVPANRAATPGATPGAAPIARKEATSYLERSTARRETGITGTSGKVTAPSARGFAPPAQQRLGRPASGTISEEHSSVLLSRLKPKKLYDQKAASIAKTLSAREKQAEEKSKKRLGDNAKLLIAFGLLLCLGTGLYFSVPEVTRVNKVSVRGMTNITEKEITDALLLSPEINLVNADIPAMESRILANPKVAAVRVGRSFPDKLVVDLTERKAVACVLVNEEIGTKSIAIDEEGVAFAYMESIAPASRLPVLSGIRFEHFAPGQRLPEYLRPLLGDIAELSKEDPSPLAAFSEIKIEKISDSEAELLLFPSGKSVPIRMPARLTKASLGSALLVLDILSGRQGAEKIEEIDFRTGTIVYRTKEAQAG